MVIVVALVTKRGYQTMPHVQLLYFASCPNTEQALQMTQDALRKEGLPLSIEMIAVETEDEAERQQFYGSPTIRVDGVDVCPPSEAQRPSMTCRLYVQPDGQFAHYPPAHAILTALRRSTHN